MAGDIIMDHHGSSTSFSSGNSAYDAQFYDMRHTNDNGPMGTGDAVNGWIGRIFTISVILGIIAMFAM